MELFAGGGGMAVGTRQAGFEHLALVEWNKNAAKILRHNAERDPSLWSTDDVHEMDVNEWLASTELRAGSVDLVAGGPPCQPFSLAGVHAGDMDNRNMFPAAIETVRKLRPRFAIFENVPGLTRPSFAPYFKYIKDQLEKPEVSPRGDEIWTEHHARVRRSNADGLRYHVHQALVEAADFGLAQNRRRVILVAIRSDIPGAADWTAPEGDYSRDALLYAQWVDGSYWRKHDLEQPEMPDGTAKRIAELAAAGPPTGRRWRTVRDRLADLPLPVDRTPHPLYANHEGIPGARAYRKHNGSPIDWPSKAIKAGVHGVSGGEAMIRYPDGSLRYYTVRESARLQGFDDDYEFPVSRSRSMGAIGNAVPVDIARILTSSILELDRQPGIQALSNSKRSPQAALFATAGAVSA